MKTSHFILVLIGALLLGAGIAAALLLSTSGAQTTVGTVTSDCTASVTDRDGDCVADSFDYYSSDVSR